MSLYLKYKTSCILSYSARRRGSIPNPSALCSKKTKKILDPSRHGGITGEVFSFIFSGRRGPSLSSFPLLKEYFEHPSFLFSLCQKSIPSFLISFLSLPKGSTPKGGDSLDFRRRKSPSIPLFLRGRKRISFGKEEEERTPFLQGENNAKRENFPSFFPSTPLYFHHLQKRAFSCIKSRHGMTVI